MKRLAVLAAVAIGLFAGVAGQWPASAQDATQLISPSVPTPVAPSCNLIERTNCTSSRGTCNTNCATVVQPRFCSNSCEFNTQIGEVPSAANQFCVTQCSTPGVGSADPACRLRCDTIFDQCLRGAGC